MEAMCYLMSKLSVEFIHRRHGISSQGRRQAFNAGYVTMESLQLAAEAYRLQGKIWVDFKGGRQRHRAQSFVCSFLVQVTSSVGNVSGINSDCCVGTIRRRLWTVGRSAISTPASISAPATPAKMFRRRGPAR